MENELRYMLEIMVRVSTNNAMQLMYTSLPREADNQYSFSKIFWIGFAAYKIH